MGDQGKPDVTYAISVLHIRAQEAWQTRPASFATRHLSNNDWQSDRWQNAVLPYRDEVATAPNKESGVLCPVKKIKQRGKVSGVFELESKPFERSGATSS